eukprot:XP_766576.1 hypothetical protein [Theileria parva strain Muguga]
MVRTHLLSLPSECDVFEFSQSHLDFLGPNFENFFPQILPVIFSPNFVKSDTCFVASNITLESLVNLDFIINFVINSKGVLTLNVCLNISFSAFNNDLQLDLEVFRTLGLSNCNIVHRNEDQSVTLEINLLDTSYLKPQSRLYDRLLTNLSKITPVTVIISSEIFNSLDLTELRAWLKPGDQFPVNSKEYSVNFFNENIKKLVQEQNLEVHGTSEKRHKTETNSDDLEHRYEKMESQREILVKIFNTLKKKPIKNKQVIKDMIHELNKKNLNEFSEKKTPIHNLLSFIDHINLESLKVGSCNISNLNGHDPGNAVDNSETYELLKLNNGIISNEYTFNLLKEAWYETKCV